LVVTPCLIFTPAPVEPILVKSFDWSCILKKPVIWQGEKAVEDLTVDYHSTVL